MRTKYTIEDVKAQIRSGPFAWPGGYPLYFIAADGEPLSFEAVRENFRLVAYATKHPGEDTQWEIIGCEINYEDPDLYCAHTGKRIESAYCEV